MTESSTPEAPPAPRVRGSTVVLLLYWALLFVGTHLPASWLGPEPKDEKAGGWLSFEHVDKVAHAVAYGGLAGLIWWAVFRRARLRWSQAGAVVALLAIYGILDELTQALTSDRTPDPWDWVADMAGTLVVLGLTGCLARPAKLGDPGELAATKIPRG